MRWSEEEETILYRMADKKCTIQQIEAVLTDRTGQGIRKKSSDLGLSVRSNNSKHGGGKIDMELFNQMMTEEPEVL